MRRRAPALLWSVTLGAAASVALVRLLENWLIFWPVKRIGADPSEFGLEFQNVTLEPVPGIRIHGWYVPAPQARARVLYLQGNGGNRSHRMGWIRILHDLGCSIFVVDYEGYGESDGAPSEAMVYRDARAARRWLEASNDDRELPLILYGESLGGAIATQLAREDPPDGLVIDHSFTTMPDMIDQVCRGVPLRWICRSRYNSIGNLKEYHGPVTIFHGDRDLLIPIAQAHRLFEAANQPKSFHVIPGAGHDPDDLIRKGEGIYRQELARFVDLVVEGGR